MNSEVFSPFFLAGSKEEMRRSSFALGLLSMCMCEAPAGRRQIEHRCPNPVEGSKHQSTSPPSTSDSDSREYGLTLLLIISLSVSGSCHTFKSTEQILSGGREVQIQVLSYMLWSSMILKESYSASFY